MKILIVEDVKINMEIYKIFLSSYNVEILTAMNGLEGIEMFRNNSDIDLILMNYQMPVMNGYDAIKKIREFNKDVIIIMVSALIGMSWIDEELSDCGANDYLGLPLKKTSLVEKIEYYLKDKLKLK